MRIPVRQASAVFIAGDDITIDEQGNIDFSWECAHMNVSAYTSDDYLHCVYVGSSEAVGCDDCSATYNQYEERWQQ